MLVAVSISALVVFQLIDSGLYRLVAPYSARLALLPDLRLTSIAILVAALVWVRPGIGCRWVAPEFRSSFAAACLISATFASVHITGVGKVQLDRWQDVAAFLVTGVIAEELLCRGLVLGVALKVFQGRSSHVAAIFWSVAIFALMHHQHHGFRFDASAWLQVAWTVPLGAVTAVLTVRSRSLMPAVLVHGLDNLIVYLA
jgi:membrane protease YdiL (CAAX protease family)